MTHGDHAPGKSLIILELSFSPGNSLKLLEFHFFFKMSWNVLEYSKSLDIFFILSFLSSILKVLNKILIIGYYLIVSLLRFKFFLSWKILDFFLFYAILSWNILEFCG